MRRPPHTPFRAGAPRFTPALAPIDPAIWLAPDTEARVLDWKAGLLAQPDLVVRQAGAGVPAASEAALAVEAALGASRTGDLRAASHLISDDLVVMEHVDGLWICSALTLTAPTFFSIDDVFGHDLRALHGPVPDGARLASRIARVFDNVRAGLVLERFNWTLQAGPERFTPDAAPLRALAARADPEAALDLLHLRVERQTIARLPQTRAVLFTIRVCLDPLSALAHGDRAVLAQAWRALGPEGRAYKGWTALEALVEAAFSRWQV
ncbi:heme-dependent oxidative N-demethylase subunit alpha family protein [Maricaulaceae bacterium MS644]